MERYIWTHFCNDDTLELPWTAVEVDFEQNPYELLAEEGLESGAVYAKTEIEAIRLLIEN